MAEAWLSLLVSAFMVVSKGVALFWTGRTLLFAAIFALIWVCLTTFSCLATHATVTTAISATERTGGLLIIPHLATWRLGAGGLFCVRSTRGANP